MSIIKDVLGLGEEKGVDCQDDPQTGQKVCRVITRHKNTLLATGSQFSGSIDPSTCKFNMQNRSTILEDDEQDVLKSIKRIESNCRGGIN